MEKELFERATTRGQVVEACATCLYDSRDICSLLILLYLDEEAVGIILVALRQDPAGRDAVIVALREPETSPKAVGR